MDISQHIDTRLPYRVGFPLLPVLPVETEYLDMSRFVPNCSDFISEINSILSGTGVKNPEIRLTHRFHKRHNTDKVTLLVTCAYDPNCHAAWIEAVKALHEFLLPSTHSFAIEIIDLKISQETPMPRAIDTEDKTFFKAINELRPMIMEAIKLNHHAWQAVDVLQWYAVEHDEHRPAFIITARDADSPTWWKTTLPSVRAKIADYPHDIGLELLYLEAITFAMGTGCKDEEGKAEHVPPHASMLNFYGLPIQAGTSCGLSGSESSGTWGGRILLAQNDQDMELGLTNSHVLLQDFLKGRARKGPFPPGALLKQGFVVVSPSDYDHAFALRGLRQTAEMARQALDTMSSYFGESPLDDYSQRKFNLLKDSNQLAQRMESDAKTFDREVGSVYAASGYTTREFRPNNDNASAYPLNAKWALDWVLFKIHPYFQLGARHKPMMWQPVDPNTVYQIKTQGRSSGKSKGCINAVASELSLTNGAPIPDSGASNIRKDTLSKTFGEAEITAHCITPREKSKKCELICPGDSGSLILADDEETPQTVYGLAFAGNEASKASYMIPAQLLVEDIQNVTGGENVRFIEW